MPKTKKKKTSKALVGKQRVPSARRTTKKKRKDKIESPPRTSKQIRRLGKELRDLAEQIDRYADFMDDLLVKKIRPLTGNWENAIDTLKKVVVKQIHVKVVTAAAQNGRDILEVLAGRPRKK